MNKSVIFKLILLTILTFSCVEKKLSASNNNTLEIEKRTESDNLTFTSGIRAVFQDSKGNYWLGSHNEGVCVYDGKTIQYFKVKDGLANNQVRSVQEDKDGNIWFGTASGMSMYDGVTVKSFPNQINNPNTPWKLTDESLWFNAGQYNGVNHFYGQRLQYLSFPLPEHIDANSSYAVTGISEDKDGSIWIATYPALFNFDGTSITFFDEKKLSVNEKDYLHIRSVLSDSQGRVWIGNNGIGVLMMHGDSVIHFSEKMGLIHKESSRSGGKSPAGTLEHVFAIEEDGDGNIWFGDRDTGAWKYDGETITNYIVDETLSSPMIWDIYKDNNNTLFFGMANGGVYTFNGTSFDKAF